ncbi:thiol peroxidase [Vibrio splendidus]|uniref:thiol peroxidase n=1 Tax=Vibrio splendidus TaxID=29497 RepID=UPI0000670202|nr:thiol peroxidase [Vibrio splendidus]EAP94529.1 thiol peroxidase [Vibrio splendidus 12B01]OCH69924.1 lipid hydroperoxide peroxidase [Vibrio splendidus]PMI24658.1 lipid hydroperoxide peroxidase [Vibrio splendidus]PMM36485.1 lipid hydroperoxide peroxidase [Vibrio splendidus]PTP64091.1 thiol peroxidase [Vibrio splendidus]
MSVTFQGVPVSISGRLPKLNQLAPNFTLCDKELNNLTLDSLKGKNVLLNIFPSIDTPICAASVRTFNKNAADLNNTVVICISADLPFAMNRFCGAEGIDNVITASFFRESSFTENYGVNLNEGALKGLSARAVVVIDQEGVVKYCELVSEITTEPNYKSALTALL